MKKYVKACILAVVLVLTNAAVYAQDDFSNHHVPAYVSAKGYWIVESNVHIPKQYTIRFYNNDHVVVYTEKVEGITLKLQRRKVKMHLKKVLETSVLAWEHQKQAKENEGWVINAMR